MRAGLPQLIAMSLVAVVTGCDDGSAHAVDAAGSDDAADAATLYPRVQAILEQSCAYVRCHAGPLVGAGLNLERGLDYAAALVGVPACEYERMARVEPFEPERSWIMVKLTADYRPREDPLPFYILFEPEPGWDPEQRGCRDRAADGTPLFGQRMPLTAPNRLPEQEIEAIRAWIAAGATP